MTYGTKSGIKSSWSRSLELYFVAKIEFGRQDWFLGKIDCLEIIIISSESEYLLDLSKVEQCKVLGYLEH